MSVIQIALLGAGRIGLAHADCIAAEPGCVLHSVVDPAAAGAALAAIHGVPHHASLASLLAGPLPHAAIVATPNALHVPQALALIERGVPVLVEKPLADNLVQARQLLDAQARLGVPVLVGHHRRHSGVMMAARQVIASGRLGRLVTVNGSATFAKPDRYFSDAPWRVQPGGGPILINLVHEIDSLRALLGEISAVQAFVSSAARGLPVEDTAAVCLRFASGVLGTFLLCDSAASPRSWEQTSAENPAYSHHPDQDCCVIAGTQGSLHIPTLTLFDYAGERSWLQPLRRETVASALQDPLQCQLTHFCQVVRGTASAMVSPADALQTLRVTLAVVEAARLGQACTI